MVEYTAPEHDALSLVFRALADPTRRGILRFLAEHGPSPVGAIAAPFGVSLQAVSKHIRVLEVAGLISRQVRGREHRCELRGTPLAGASAWVEEYRRFWERSFDALARALEEPDVDGGA